MTDEGRTIAETLADGGFIGFTIRPWRFTRNNVLRDLRAALNGDGLKMVVHQKGGWLRSTCHIEVHGFRDGEHFKAWAKGWYRWMNANEWWIGGEDER